MSFESFNENNDSIMSEINVTPLVDVMLVLLIVFMITMPVLTTAIPLNLPTASSIENQNKIPEKPFRISIDADGRYFIKEQMISLEEFSSILRKEKEINEDVILAISADQSVDYGYVVDVLSTAQKEGVSKIGFIAEEDKN